MKLPHCSPVSVIRFSLIEEIVNFIENKSFNFWCNFISVIEISEFLIPETFLETFLEKN